MTDTDLRSTFESALAEVRLDTARLAATAARQGTRIRRRNSAGLALGISTSLAVVLGIGAMAATSGEGAPGNELWASSSQTAANDVPLTGRTTTAALRDLIAAHTDASMSGFAGTDTATLNGAESAEGAETDVIATMGSLRLTPEGSNASVPVMISVAHNSPGRAVEDPCTDPSEFGYARNCTESDIGSWKVLRFERHVGGAVERIVNAYDPARDVRIWLTTTNGAELPRFRDTPDGQPTPLPADTVVDQPILSFEQMDAIATWEHWGPKIPADYQRKGMDLTPYSDETIHLNQSATDAG